MYFTQVKQQSTWCVYIVECSDGTFYTGVTNNLDRRIIEHNTSKKGAKYTAARRPVKLLCYLAVENKSEALKLELKVKKKKRKDKLNFMRSLNCTEIK